MDKTPADLLAALTEVGCPVILYTCPYCRRAVRSVCPSCGWRMR